MRTPQVLALACLAQLACDVKKLGVEGATCSASSDCADDLQCMQSVCVRPQAAGVAARPAPPPAASAPPPAPSAPAVSTPQVPLPAAPAASATPPAATPSAAAPAPAPPPHTAPQLPPADTIPPKSGIPWLNRAADAAPSEATKVADPAPQPAPAPIPSTPADPAFLFTDPGSWTALVESGEPWAASVLKALQGIRIGSYGGGAQPLMLYKFRLVVCPDGRLEPYRKQGTGDAQFDDAMDNAIKYLKVAAPPTAIRTQLAGACKKIPYDFTMKFGGGKTEVK